MKRQRNSQKDIFYLKCKEINGDTIDISSFVYNGVRGKGLCKCKICGHEWYDTPERLYKRKNCPECHKIENYHNNRKRLLIKHKNKASELYKSKNISDINFFYNDKNVLMVSFYCHEKYIDGTEHGIQRQNGHYFLKGGGCAKCAPNLSKAYTTEEWVRIAKNKYPEFNYEKTIYVNKDTKVLITCSKHGDVWVNPKEFIHGNGYCSECIKERLHNEFVDRVIKRAQKIHKEEDYIYHPELIYSSTEKIGIECKKHGIFWQKIGNHIINKCKCPQCAIEKTAEKNKQLKIKYQETFVKRANKVHNNKYVYNKTIYNGNENKVIITCPEHGDFEQTPHSHLNGGGCPICAKAKTADAIRLTQEEFLNRIKEIHKNKDFDFSKVVYNGGNEKVTVICPKHGEFNIKAMNLLVGNGCPICRMPKLEIVVKNILIDNDIKNIPQYKTKWLGRQSLDFYLPDCNIAIECQGLQHFKNERRYQNLEEVQKRDEKKKQLCKENNVHLIYFVPEIFAQYMSEDDIYFTNTNDLIDYIKKYYHNVCVDKK